MLSLMSRFFHSPQMMGQAPVQVLLNQQPFIYPLLYLKHTHHLQTNQHLNLLQTRHSQPHHLCNMILLAPLLLLFNAPTPWLPAPKLDHSSLASSLPHPIPTLNPPHLHKPINIPIGAKQWPTKYKLYSPIIHGI